LKGILNLEKLFSYGTLQMDKVQQETFGRSLSGKKEILLGYVISKIKITDQSVLAKSGTEFHPILRYTGNRSDEVEGIIFEISKKELQQADAYEVNAYKRTQANFKSGTIAWAYVAAE
jgi:gamma-glutamylcyclotransferase (GGCT)/AIG2-like uncharacterized protein YtfP